MVTFVYLAMQDVPGGGKVVWFLPSVKYFSTYHVSFESW